MDPITATLLTALIAGAAAGVTGVATQAITDAYNGLKALVIAKFGGKSDVESAIQQVDKKPDSAGRQGVLKEELEGAVKSDPSAAQDQELQKQAEKLLALLQEKGQPTSGAVHIEVSGSGAVAYGD